MLIYSSLGALMSVSFLVLLMVPGMPAFMPLPSWIALGGWVVLGTIFFVVKAPSLRAMSKSEMDYLVLGRPTAEPAS